MLILAGYGFLPIAFLVLFIMWLIHYGIEKMQEEERKKEQQKEQTTHVQRPPVNVPQEETQEPLSPMAKKLLGKSFDEVVRIVGKPTQTINKAESSIYRWETEKLRATLTFDRSNICCKVNEKEPRFVKK